MSQVECKSTQRSLGMLIEFVASVLANRPEFEISLLAIDQIFALHLPSIEKEELWYSHNIEISDLNSMKVTFRRKFQGKPLKLTYFEKNSVELIKRELQKLVENESLLTIQFSQILCEIVVPLKHLLIRHTNFLSDHQFYWLCVILQICGYSGIALKNVEARDSIDRIELIDPYFDSTCWTKEGARQSPLVSKEIENFKKIESGDVDTIKEHISSPVPSTMLFKLKAVCGVAWLFMQVFGLIFASRKPWNEISEWIKDEQHWYLTNSILSSYWFGPERGCRPTYALVVHALKNKSLYLKVRTLDWALFVFSHGMYIPFCNSLYAILSKISQLKTPNLSAEIFMHRSILNFYEGRLFNSFYLQSLNERRLADGEHDFNRLINLSNAMRTALAMQQSSMVNLLYHKCSKIEGFERGHLRERTLLNFWIQQARLSSEDLENKDELKKLCEKVDSLPPLQRESTKLLLALAYFELGKYRDSLSLIENVERDLIKSGFIRSYRYIYLAIRELIEPKKKFSLSLRVFGRDWSKVGQRMPINFSSNYKNEIQKNFFYGKGVDIELLPSTQMGNRMDRESNLVGHFNEREALRNPTFSIRFLRNQKIVFSNAINEPNFDFLKKLSHEGQGFYELNDLRYSFDTYATGAGVKWITVDAKLVNSNLIFSFDEVRIGAPIIEDAKPAEILGTFLALINEIVGHLHQIYEEEYRINAIQTLESQKSYVAIAQVAKQVAHDIRSPLSAINLAVSVLTDIPEEGRKLIRNAAQRMNDIANELLMKGKASEESKYSSGNCTEILPAGILIDDIISEKRIQHRGKINLELSFDFSDGFGAFVEVNGSEIKRVFSNLIENSLESFNFHESKEKIFKVQLFVVMSPASVCIEIRDNGRGIPAATLERLGEIGVSWGKSREAGSGSGLGVYHAKRTIERHGGKIEFQSKLEEGTVVRIFLPRAKPPAWFKERITILPGTQIVSVDDDVSIHNIWQKRFANIINDNTTISLRSFTCIDTFQNYVQQNNFSASTLFLIDFEFLGHKLNGCDVIQKLGIENRSILVTSQTEDEYVLENCKRLNIQAIPKLLAGTIPLDVEDFI